MFQSTHPCGVRISKLIDVEAHEIVSIHAPVWGANSWQISTKVAKTFQSTHPCGVRKVYLAYCQIGYRFNPRTRVGCEFSERNIHASASVSIHAPVWGANDGSNDVYFILDVSIHAPVWGAKAKTKVSQMTKSVSIHAPVWGANTCGHQVSSTATVSIHAPVWGANLGKDIAQIKATVSIHAPVWGANKDGKLTADRLLVSIHAPVWGAKMCPMLSKTWFMFQSTHPCGVRSKQMMILM